MPYFIISTRNLYTVISLTFFSYVFNYMVRNTNVQLFFDLVKRQRVGDWIVSSKRVQDNKEKSESVRAQDIFKRLGDRAG